jgi:hypothetical protein
VITGGPWRTGRPIGPRPRRWSGPHQASSSAPGAAGSWASGSYNWRILHIAKVAKENDIQVVHTYRAINGPNGDQGPPSEILQTDGLHFNSKGHNLLADLHRQVGYGSLGP